MPRDRAQRAKQWIIKEYAVGSKCTFVLFSYFDNIWVGYGRNMSDTWKHFLD